MHRHNICLTLIFPFKFFYNNFTIPIEILQVVWYTQSRTSGITEKGCDVEVEVIVDLIGNLGFPIAMSILLIWVLYKQSEEAKKADIRWQDLLSTSTREWQTVINNNTLAMNKMLSKLNEFSETNRALKDSVDQKKEL